MSDGSVVGADIPRWESPLKADGRARFTDDYTPREMVYGAVLRSPHPHARVRAIDCAEALARPGVPAVLGPEDVAEIRYNSSGEPAAPERPIPAGRERGMKR